MRQHARALLPLLALTLTLSGGAECLAGDEHWSRQFPIPNRKLPKMMPNVGMSGGASRPNIQRTQWHDGKLWMAGAWESGTPARNLSKTEMNEYWYLWSWSPVHGWEAMCYFHSARGGSGPDGKLYDFLWLPDGRLVVAGSFRRIDNPGGIMYHRVPGLAIYDPKEPTANKWKPLGKSFQYNGCAGGGTIYALGYDPQADKLYMGGNFGGLTDSPRIHYYDFKTGSLEPLKPGVAGGKASVRKIVVDTRTKPSTIYIGGDFFYTAGDGRQPAIKSSTSRISTGLAAWQDGTGWRTFPEKGVERRQDNHKLVLTVGPGHKYPKGTVLDILLDGDDIWIVGGFGGGQKTGQNVAGIAKWDREKQVWIDPTGKGGVGRDCYSIAKAKNGKIYFGGAFGGSKGSDFFPGFRNGDKAPCAISYDPKTKAWEALGSGLGTITMPEVRMTVNGNDVYFVGDFQHIGAGRTGKGKTKKDDQPWESSYVARWNETIDFTKTPAKVAKTSTPTPNLYPQPTKPIFSGTEHWSRAFPKPTRAKPMSGKTGMGGYGAPQIYGMVKHRESLYFVGSWEVKGTRWFSWRWHPIKGWEPLSWKKGLKVVGPIGLFRGIKLHKGKLWGYGALSNFHCIGIYDPATGKWSKLEGKTVDGEAVVGNGIAAGGGIVGDIAWDSKTDDLYFIGSHGVKDKTRQSPASVSQCVRVDKSGVYHTMGWRLMAQNLAKPILHMSAILIDEKATPSDIYIAGTFNYYGPSSHNSRMSPNIVKWDYKGKDWTRVGHGNMADVSPLDKKHYPKGLPGVRPVPPRGFLQAEFARIRVMRMDKDRNIYIGGTLAIRDPSLPVAQRKESFGLAKLEFKTQKWVPCTKVGGVSRDVFNMTWLDEQRLLISGGFHYDEQWNPLNGIAIFDIKTGELSGVGGGGMRFHRSQTISSDIVHCVDGDDWYFAGLFEYVGINLNSLVAAPIESYFVAHYNAKKNLDPNRGLSVDAPPAIPRVTGFSSKMIEIKASAKVSEPGGTLTWYLRKTNGDWDKKGSGPSFKTKVRIKATSPEPVIYVSVTRDGVEGGKLPIRVPFK